jgi:hypothetical protein
MYQIPSHTPMTSGSDRIVTVTTNHISHPGGSDHVRSKNNHKDDARNPTALMPVM